MYIHAIEVNIPRPFGGSKPPPYADGCGLRV